MIPDARDAAIVAGSLITNGAVAVWLSGLDWTNPYGAADQIQHVLSVFARRAEEEGDTTAAALYHEALDWLDSHQDPARGLWGDEAADVLNAVAAAGVLVPLYVRVHRPVRAMRSLAEHALTHIGSSNSDFFSSMSRLLAFVAAKSKYRRSHIERVLGPAAFRIGNTTVSRVWMRCPIGGGSRFRTRGRAGVVVTCFNLGEYLYEALETIASQTFADLELIIVNDGSTDRFTIAYLEFLSEHGFNVIHQSNKGLSEARNNGIRALSAPYICCFDADDRMHPEWIERAVAALEPDPGLGFVSCYYRTFDNDGSTYRYDQVHLPEMLVQNGVVGVSVFRREAWIATGGYSPRFRNGMEDWDFWVGLLAAGYKGRVIPDILFEYRARIGSMYTETRRPDTYAENTALMVERHRGCFEAHWPDVVRLRAFRFAELVQCRAAETSAYEASVRSLEAAKTYQAQQAAAWQQTAEASERKAEEARQHAATWEQSAQEVSKRAHSLEQQLNTQRELHRTLHDQLAVVAANLEVLLDRPGVIVRSIQNVMLLLSRRHSKWWNVALATKLIADTAKRAVWARYFDAAWYTRRNRDVARSGVHPALHYLIHGHAEGRAPSETFDGTYYLQRHPDVAAAGINPLLHYSLYGESERRMCAPVSVQPITEETDAASSGHAVIPLPPASIAPVVRPLISVVIPCFNYGAYVEEAVCSVLQQTFRNFELILVEGGSTDGTTPNVVRSISERYGSLIRTFFRSEPHLAGDNRNFGIQHARGRYVCCLDADDRIAPTYLECAAFLAESYTYDLISTSVESFGDETFTWVPGHPQFPSITEYNQVATAAVFRKSLWQQSGGFRDWGRGPDHVAEDWEFWVRLLGNGARATAIQRAFMLYRVHKQSLSRTCERALENQRQAILAANAELIHNPAPRPSVPEPTIHPWENLVVTDEAVTETVLIALPFITIGGAETQYAALVRGLLKQGFRVVVITTEVLPDTMTDDTAKFEQLTAHVYPLPGILGWETNRWRDFLFYLLSRYRVEIMLTVGNTFVYNSLPAIVHNFPRLTILDQLFNDGVHFESNKKYRSFIDATITVSPVLTSTVVASGEEAARVVTIPNALDIEVADSGVGATTGPDLPPGFTGKCVVSFFGRLSPEKAPLDFIALATRLKDVSDMRFLLAGEGPECDAVLRAISDNGLQDRVYAPGAVRNVRSLMRQSDVIVVPSRLDGMPTVVLEAQDEKRPVVASNVGSIPTMIQDGITGYLCEPGDIEAFAGRVLRLAHAPEMRLTMGEAGRAFVRERFTADQMVRSYIEVFRSIRKKNSGD